MTSTFLRALGALLVTVVVPTSLAAQMVEAGVARDAARGTPYECLHVALLDSTGKAIEHTVTDSAGRFLLEAPRPGVYRVEFIIVAAEPLAGPVDTIKEGDFRQRAYPLTFRRLLTDDTTAGPEYQEQWRRDSTLARALYALESDSGWRSRRAVPAPTGPRYPEKLKSSGVGGSVTSLFIVDSTGKTRPDSWHLIAATHPDFEKAVVKSLPNWRWKPALNHGQPVCQLGFDFIKFYTEDGKPLALVQRVGRIVLYR